MMLFSMISLILGLFADYAQAQGQNNLYIYNEYLRTMSSNGTWFIVPVDAATLQSCIGYPLLPVPTDSTLFPTPFPTGMHPLMVANYYCNDIRMDINLLLFSLPLSIASLMAGEVYAPFVDRLGDGKTPFKYPFPGGVLIGGTNGQSLMGVVPSLVGSTEGPITLTGQFTPDTAAWQQNPDGSNTAGAKALIFPNSVSGPGVAEPLYDLEFITSTTPLYTSHTFHSLMNQPIILPTGECLRNTNYFNDTYTDPIQRTGNVTLYASPLPSGLAGVYTGIGGYSAEGQTVGYNVESCTSAAADLDPYSLE